MYFKDHELHVCLVDGGEGGGGVGAGVVRTLVEPDTEEESEEEVNMVGQSHALRLIPTYYIQSFPLVQRPVRGGGGSTQLSTDKTNILDFIS